MPDDEVHAFVNDLERPVGTYLYGRRMYEVMVGWETPRTRPAQSPPMRDYAAIWRAADKVVYSRRCAAAASAEDAHRARVRSGGGAADEGGRGRDISVGGPGLAAAAIRAGLVDEC